MSIKVGLYMYKFFLCLYICIKFGCIQLNLNKIFVYKISHLLSLYITQIIQFVFIQSEKERSAKENW